MTLLTALAQMKAKLIESKELRTQLFAGEITQIELEDGLKYDIPSETQAWFADVCSYLGLMRSTRPFDLPGWATGDNWIHGIQAMTPQEEIPVLVINDCSVKAMEEKLERSKEPSTVAVKQPKKSTENK